MEELKQACDKPYTSKDKWIAAIVLGLLFLLLSSPYILNLEKNIYDGIESEGCITIIGIFVQAIIYMLIFRLLMNKKGPKGCVKPYGSKDKWIIAIIGALLFVLLTSPFLYQATNSVTMLLGFEIADNGCPNVHGLIVHTLLFIAIVRVLMR